MSYIKVELGGKERGLKFNQLALEIIRTKNNPKSDIQNVYALFYGGLRGNSFVKEEEPDYSFEDVCDWVDELYIKPEAGEIIKSVSDVFTGTQMYQSLIASVEDKKPEKKRQLRKVS